MIRIISQLKFANGFGAHRLDGPTIESHRW